MVGYEATGERSRADLAALPEIVYVSDLAKWLRTSEKAIRDRVRRGQLPKPEKVGRRCAWSRGSIVSSTSENAAGRPECTKMRITLRPYFKDRSRFQVDLQFTDPTTNAPVRARPVAPKGLTERQAHAWGMGELAKLLRGQGNLTTAPTIRREESAPIPPAPKHIELTLEVFFRDNFTPNYSSFSGPRRRPRISACPQPQKGRQAIKVA